MSYNESLSRNSNYPLMSQSQWDNAPWNQVEAPDVDVRVVASQSFCRGTTITTNNYNEDGEGYRNYYEIQNSYKEQAMLPSELIKNYKELLENLRDGKVPTFSKSNIEFLIEECKDWLDAEDETEISLDED